MAAARQHILDIDKLPTLPSIAIEAIKLMEGEHSTFDSVADLLRSDQVLSSKILHYANSAFIGARKVASINQAISVLGFNAVRTIILSATIFDSFSKQFSKKQHGLVNFWIHSIGVATTAEKLAKKLGAVIANGGEHLGCAEQQMLTRFWCVEIIVCNYRQLI